MLVYASKKQVQKYFDETLEELALVRQKFHAVKTMSTQHGMPEWKINQALLRIANSRDRNKKLALSSLANATFGSFLNEDIKGLNKTKNDNLHKLSKLNSAVSTQPVDTIPNLRGASSPGTVSQTVTMENRVNQLNKLLTPPSNQIQRAPVKKLVTQKNRSNKHNDKRYPSLNDTNWILKNNELPENEQTTDANSDGLSNENDTPLQQRQANVDSALQRFNERGQNAKTNYESVNIPNDPLALSTTQRKGTLISAESYSSTRRASREDRTAVNENNTHPVKTSSGLSDDDFVTKL